MIKNNETQLMDVNRVKLLHKTALWKDDPPQIFQKNITTNQQQDI